MEKVNALSVPYYPRGHGDSTGDVGRTDEVNRGFLDFDNIERVSLCFVWASLRTCGAAWGQHGSPRVH